MGFFPLAYGIVFRSAVLSGAAVLVLLIGYFGWIIEPLTEGDDDPTPA